MSHSPFLINPTQTHAHRYFLRLGYVVIFLYRPGTACPFARSFQGELSEHVDGKFLDTLKARGACM